MKHLLYKEFKLAKHPTMYVFPLFALMMLIPDYPYLVAFFYTCLEIFYIFLQGRETRDVSFTTLLPISRRQVVYARTGFVLLIQLFQMLLSIPFALLGRHIDPTPGNAAGLDITPAFYGVALAAFGLFNLIYLCVFYRTAYKAGMAFLWGSAGFVLLGVAAEILTALIPALHDFFEPVQGFLLARQWPALLAGLLLFVALTAIGAHRSAKLFEKVDL